MFSQALDERKAVIKELYSNFVGMGLNSHFPSPSIGLWPQEIERLMWCQLEAPNLPTIIIGSHNGGSELVAGLVKAYKGDTTPIFSIDIKFNDFYDLMIKRLKNRVKCDIIKWEMNSTDLGEVYGEFSGEAPLGLVFIDGFHSYNQCLSDFAQVDKFLISNSIACFHDCSPKYPKRNSKLPENFINHLNFEDFEIDAAIAKILENDDFEELNIPVGNECDRRRETQRSEWVKGQTSPFNSLFGIKVKELART